MHFKDKITSQSNVQTFFFCLNVLKEISEIYAEVKRNLKYCKISKFLEPIYLYPLPLTPPFLIYTDYIKCSQ